MGVLALNWVAASEEKPGTGDTAPVVGWIQLGTADWERRVKMAPVLPETTALLLAIEVAHTRYGMPNPVSGQKKTPLSDRLCQTTHAAAAESNVWTAGAYDTNAGAATPLLVPPAGSYLRGVAVAPDGTKIVYCLETGDRRDLHLVDATVSPATDVALTTDGVSCQPSF